MHFNCLNVNHFALGMGYVFVLVISRLKNILMEEQSNGFRGKGFPVAIAKFFISKM